MNGLSSHELGSSFGQPAETCFHVKVMILKLLIFLQIGCIHVSISVDGSIELKILNVGLGFYEVQTWLSQTEVKHIFLIDNQVYGQ